MRVIGYTRVSTDSQAESGAGLDAQEAAIKAECDRQGWDLIRNATDTASGGKGIAGRKALAEAVADLRDGKADALVAAKLDRVARSMRVFADLLDEADRHGWRLVVLDVAVDTSTPSGELLVTVMSAFSQYERRIIGLRTRDALAAKRTAGIRLGRPVELPTRTRRRIARDRSKGRSFQSIADKLNEENVPTARGGNWHASTVRAVIQSLALDELAQSA